VTKAILRLARSLAACLAALRISRMSAAGAFASLLALTSYAGTTTYTYDVHGRLTSVTAPSGSLDKTVTNYSYDNTGNRQQIVVSFQDHTPPNPPTGLSATAQSYSWIQLNWTASHDVGGGPVASYKVYRGGTNVGSTSGSSYNDQGLQANTPYTYTVSAVDPAGNESTGNPSASATTPPAPDVTPPSVPQNLQGSAVSGTWVNLSWTASTDTGGSGLAGYEIFRNGGLIGSSSVASYSDQSASSAVTYTYQVRAYDGAGNRSGLSNQISVTTPDTVAPSAPGSPTFSSVTCYSATINWTAASDNVGVTGYRYSLNGGSSWTSVGITYSVSLSGLPAGAQYAVRIQAGDAAGNWGPSSAGTLTINSTCTDAMSITGGQTATNWNGLYYNTYYYGYGQGWIGSLSPGTTANGKTITSYYSYYDIPSGASATILVVTGFNGNPGAGWLQSISISTPSYGSSVTGASATFWCSSSTTCNWSWPTMDASFTDSGTLTIVHQ
jgi:YD repeat-containing protein